MNEERQSGDRPKGAPQDDDPALIPDEEWPDEERGERISILTVARAWWHWCLAIIFVLTIGWTALVAWTEITSGDHIGVPNTVIAIITVAAPGEFIIIIYSLMLVTIFDLTGGLFVVTKRYLLNKWIYPQERRIRKEAHQKGLEEGREQGREEGIEEGREQGVVEGREQGVMQGREQGREEGREQGVKQGREQGIEQGRTEGREEGVEQGREQGVQQGIEQGIAQGRAEERQAWIDRERRRQEAEAKGIPFDEPFPDLNGHTNNHTENGHPNNHDNHPDN